MTSRSRLSDLVSLAPVVVLAHVVEEAPGLIDWMNRHFGLDLTMSYFVVVNTVGVLMTAFLAVPRITSQDRFRALALIAWLSFVMLANSVVHLSASLVFREYAPGTLTAGLLYLPYFFLASGRICRDADLRPRSAVLAATMGAVPMLVQAVSIFTGRGRVLW